MAALLVVCVVLVGVWEFLSNRSRRPLDPFQINAEDFAGFMPAGQGWSVETVPLQQSRIEPNILAYGVRREPDPAGGPAAASAWRGRVFLRLVHGYNMPDCMRIKGYTVQLIQDTREGRPGAWGGRRLQIWRLTAAADEESIWVTSMLRVGDFSETEVDVCDMAFPRIGTPDDPGWLPRGIFRKDFLSHPARNFRLLIRAKWNNARCDLATFLKLKQPAWASDELLTLVATTEGLRVTRDQEPSAISEVVAAHGFVYEQLKQWRAKASGAAAPSQAAGR